MRNKYHCVYVLCPANTLTAGPEALHQLVAKLNELGQPAAIVYTPTHKQHTTPSAYKKYAVPISRYVDCKDDLIIFPEIMPVAALRVKNAQAAIWWMSVNNYTCERYENYWRDQFRYFKNWIKRKRPLFGIKTLKHLLHFAQSYYAEDFLKKFNISSQLLSDPIPEYTRLEYLTSLAPHLNKKNRNNIIFYNPKKGMKIIKKLMRLYPKLIFKPLIGLDRAALAETFLSGKIYIDFGHHPGKDRLPREAAIHGCCVITNLYGSAANAHDVPIPDEYKFNIRSDFYVSCKKLIEDIFFNFLEHQKAFEAYRHAISQEAINFDQQVLKNFFITT